MAARQRRGRPRKGDYTASISSNKTIPTSRRTLLLSILAVTTAVFFAFQISRYKNENSATGRLISSMLHPKSDGLELVKSRVGKGVGGDDDSKLVELKDRISVLAKHFQKELGAVVADKSSSTKPAEGGITVVEGEGVVDHSIPSLISTDYLPEKSPEEAAEDQQIGLQDLDQDTLKAMFDALYARD